MLNKNRMVITLICSALLTGCAMIEAVTGDIEQPHYEVISSDNNIEIRQYAPMIIAEVDVQGKREESISKGFRLLADYIFGNNTVQQQIAMTTPVQQEISEKIAMTAPVQQQSSGDLWKVSFVMPAAYTLKTLPKPNKEDVKLKQIPAKRFVTLQFSGMHSNNNIAKYEQQLMQHIAEKQIQTIGTVKYAFYNPPWTLPFLRRNEVMIEIE